MTHFLLIIPGMFFFVTTSRAQQEKVGGLARSREQGWDKVLGALWCPSAGHRKASTAPRCSPKVNLGPWSVLGPYSVSERCCHAGEGSWKTVGFILSVWRQILKKLPSRSSLSETYGGFSNNLLTAIQVCRRLLRYCFQVWYKMKKRYFSERKITPLKSLLPIARFCPPTLSGSSYHHGRNDEKESGLRSEPKLVHIKPGEHSWAAARHVKLIKTFWLTCGPGHVITPLLCLVSTPCTAGTKSCSVSLIFWMSIGGSVVLLRDVAMECRLLAKGMPNQVDIHPAPNRA